MLKNVRNITLLLLALLVAGCAEPPPEDEVLINRHLTSMLQAAQNKDLDTILSYLDEDFLGNGRIRKANIKGMLFLHFRQNTHLHVLMRVAEIKVEGESAEVMTQVITAGREENLIPERGRVLEITSRWAKRDGDWRVMEASWRDPLYESFR